MEIIDELLRLARDFLSAKAMNWEDIIMVFGGAINERDHIVSVPVNSSAIDRLEYDTQNEAMVVTFTDGTIYDYPGIRQDQFMQFVNAPSKGVFFNAYVRGRWSSTVREAEFYRTSVERGLHR